jgi:hypothetical protein
MWCNYHHEGRIQALHTNNGIERLFGMFKKLLGRHAKRLNPLTTIQILLDKFFPQLETR